jgi:hypothetical protein
LKREGLSFLLRRLFFLSFLPLKGEGLSLLFRRLLFLSFLPLKGEGLSLLFQPRLFLSFLPLKRGSLRYLRFILLALEWEPVPFFGSVTPVPLAAPGFRLGHAHHPVRDPVGFAFK